MNRTTPQRIGSQSPPVTGRMNRGCSFAACWLILMAAAQAQTAILTINAASRLSDVSGNPVGINLNYMMDDDARIARGTATHEAIRNLRVGYMRYPGGEKSDNYLWSSAPWSSASPHAARPHAWPTTETRFFEADQATAKSDVLDFDEFMALCQQSGAKPFICVAFDGMYKAASGSETPPTKQQLLNNAVEWVRYANVTKGYNIKHWTLGNETDYGETYAGAQPAVATFAADVVEFSQAMKAVDPSIHIGINGHTKAWFDSALAVAAANVDYLEVHTYPYWQSTSYEDYRSAANDTLMTAEIKKAINSINGLPNQSDRDRLYVTLTEFGANSFGSPPWENVNNLGKALATLDILASNLEFDRLKMAMFWNTRWVNNDQGRVIGQDPSSFEILTAQDPGLEAGGTGWTLKSNLLITSDANSGTKALRATSAYHSKSVPTNLFQPNTTYVFYCYAKQTAGSPWTGAGISFFNGGVKTEAVVTTNSSTYTRFSATVTTPANIDSAVLWISAGTGGSTLTVDDFSILPINAAIDPPSAFDALDRAGNLNATGRAVSMFAQFLKDDMVGVTGETSGIRCFATRSDAGALSIFVINKELSSQSTTINISNHSGTRMAACWQLTGSGIEDTEPTWKRISPQDFSSGSLTINLPATSITVFDFASIPKAIVSPVSTNNREVSLVWDSSESWKYSLQRSSTLLDGSWQNITGAQDLPGINAAFEYIDDFGTTRPDRHFYRLIYEPLPASSP